MNKFSKSFSLCLISAALLGYSGNVPAVNAQLRYSFSADAGDDREIVSSAVSEEVLADPDLIMQYLTCIGSVDNFDVYFKDKDFDDKLWESVGGKPKRKADYSEEQKKIAGIVDELKKTGEMTIVSRDSHKAEAAFYDCAVSDDKALYISDGGSFLLTVKSDRSAPVELLSAVSVGDDPYIFRSADRKTLKLTDRSFSSITAVFDYKGREDGKAVFSDRSGDRFVWLSGDQDSVLGVYRYAAENDSFRLIVDDRYANVGLEDKKSGYVWWSSPAGASGSTAASALIAQELRSSLKLRCGDLSNRSNNNYLRSASPDCDVSVSDISGGVRAVYSFGKAGISVPVEYTLGEDCLKAAVKVSDIKESGGNIVITEMSLLGCFGAADSREDGYFIVPDGCGALIRFNNGRYTDNNAYSQRVYGNDITAVPASRGAVTQQVYLPVYGIVRDNAAMLAVAAKGDSNAVLSAQVSGQSNSDYNLCGFSFVLRDTDTFYMSGNSSDKVTVFQGGDIASDDIEMHYYPIAGKHPDYSDVAAKYRSLLISEGGVEPCAAKDKAPVYIDLYGGVLKKKPVLGIPVTQRQEVTTFAQAKSILSQLRDNGADDMVVSLNNWTDDGIRSRVDKSADPSGILGGSSGFNDLLSFADDMGISVYPASDCCCFYSGGGYSSYGDTALRISGSYSRIVSYDRAYGIPDGFRKNMSLLSPACFDDALGGAADAYADAGLYGISPGRMTTYLYGDYGRKNISRADTQRIITDNLSHAAEILPGGVLADGANAYALPFVSHVTGVPLSSSRFDIFDEDIPFYQMVLHGVIPYSTTPVNGDPDSDKLLLMAAATGSLLSYDLIYAETNVLKDTPYDIYYYANYKHWTESAAAEYLMLRPVLSAVSDAFMTSYSVSSDGNIITSVFSNGCSVTADLDKKTIDCGDIHISLIDREKEGGIVF